MPYDAVRNILITSGAPCRTWSGSVSRTFDVAMALVGLLALAPLMCVVAAAVLIEGRGPVIFRHERIGMHDRRFLVFKFRTMCIDGDRVLEEHLQRSPSARREWETDHKLRDDPRVSKLGAFLRKSSLDELPQLWNVLKGDMSIVGPRPIVEAEVVKYGACFDAYCAVRPGITGIWQVSGRSDLTYRRRVEMDALYARKKSISFDLRIILATIPAVLLRKGSY